MQIRIVVSNNIQLYCLWNVIRTKTDFLSYILAGSGAHHSAQENDKYKITHCSRVVAYYYYFIHIGLTNIFFGIPSMQPWDCSNASDTMTPSNGNIFRFIGSLWGKSTGDRWIPLTKASDAELRSFLWGASKQTVEQTVELLAIWDAMMSTWRHCNEGNSWQAC